MNSIEEASPSIFDWNATQVQLLCFGFIRAHLADHNIQIDDIAKIVHKNCATTRADIGLIHNKFYGQVSTTQDLLNFLTDKIYNYENLTDKNDNVRLKYNQSIDDSKLQASTGVEVKCPDCKCKSVAYDSYTVVSLPVPTRYRAFEFTWIGEHVNLPIVYGFQVLFKLFVSCSNIKYCVKRHLHIKKLTTHIQQR